MSGVDWQVLAEWWARAGVLVSQPLVMAAGRALLVLVIGILVARATAVAAGRAVERFSPGTFAVLARRATFYLLVGLILASVLRELGFDLSVLLGAAGILTVAVGFASQTSASNLISGIFLVLERSFGIGDVIRVGTTTGEVVSIDLLSVKLRTFDNLYVRVPNEVLIKGEITSLTRFPIRRVDLTFHVALDTDLATLHRVLMDAAERNPEALVSPPPQVKMLGFGENGVQIEYSVWTRRENFLELRNEILREAKTAFEEAGIALAYPQRALSASRRTTPVPIRIVQEEAPTRDPGTGPSSSP